MYAASSSERRRLVGLAGHSGDADTARLHLADRSATVRIAAVRSLERLAVLSTEELVSALDDTDHTVRVAGVEIAARRQQPPIVHLLDDTESDVVEAAAWALGERMKPNPGTVAKLATTATEHSDPLARESAVAALGALGDERGLPAILVATHDKPAVRRRAIIALSTFIGPEVDEAWERARTDPDRQVREAVEELLGPW